MVILVLSGMLGLLGPAHATGKRCQMNAIERSKCIIEAILADISRNYSQVGGGGISAIKQNSTTSFTVSISQEERVDLARLATRAWKLAEDGLADLVQRRRGFEDFEYLLVARRRPRRVSPSLLPQILAEAA